MLLAFFPTMLPYVWEPLHDQHTGVTECLTQTMRTLAETVAFWLPVPSAGSANGAGVH